MRRAAILFSVTCAVAAVLAVAIDGLILASLPLADRVPSGCAVLVVHLVVAGMFLILGLLLAGMAWQACGIARAMIWRRLACRSPLETHVTRLLAVLVVFGVGLVCGLAVVISAVLSRIGEGYAVFGCRKDQRRSGTAPCLDMRRGRPVARTSQTRLMAP
jgi:hypothetical protein